jgi:hypothetical protein
MPKLKTILQKIDSHNQEKDLEDLEKKIEDYIKSLGEGAEYDLLQSSAYCYYDNRDLMITTTILTR